MTPPATRHLPCGRPVGNISGYISSPFPAPNSEIPPHTNRQLDRACRDPRVRSVRLRFYGAPTLGSPAGTRRTLVTRVPVVVDTTQGGTAPLVLQRGRV